MTTTARLHWCPLLPLSLAAVVSLPVLLLGCRTQVSKEEPSQPFVFRSLNLRQKDSSGRPLWELTSPEVRYDLGRRVAQARDLRGTIYAKGQPLYLITASSGTVINDGELVQLAEPPVLKKSYKHDIAVVVDRLKDAVPAEYRPGELEIKP